MIETLLHLRNLQTRDWATLLFLFSFVLIAIIKSVFENRFSDFMRLLVSNKYVKVYRDSSNLSSGFTIVIFLVHLVSLAFFIQLSLNTFQLVAKTDWIVFIQIFTFLFVFILSKYLIEMIMATSFNIEEIIEQYNLQKVSYRTYIGLLLLPIDIVLFYNGFLSKYVIYATIAILLAINLINYLVSLKNYQNLILRKLFYFILYLCALEIAPYYFLYYWFTKS
jgi:Domain of unknown function (DUF4271)